MPTEITLPVKTLTPYPPTPINTEIVQSKAKCPELTAYTYPVFPEGITTLRVHILTYLNRGGDPQKLSEALNGLIRHQGQRIMLRIIPVDINGDGINEIVVLTELLADKDPHETAVWIFSCSAGKYKDVGPTMGGPFSYDPKIMTVEDINGDHVPEIIFHLGFAGSGCLEEYHVVGWSKSEVIDYLTDNFFPCETKLEVQDENQDKRKKLVFTGEIQAYKVKNLNPSNLGSMMKFIYTYELIDAQTYGRVSEQYQPLP